MQNARLPYRLYYANSFVKGNLEKYQMMALGKASKQMASLVADHEVKTYELS